MTTIEERRKKIEELEKIALGGESSVNQFVPNLKNVDVGVSSLLNENKSPGPGVLGAIDRKFGNILQDSGFLENTEERVAGNAIEQAKYLDQPAYIIDNSTGQLIPDGVTKFAPRVAQFGNAKNENGQN